MGTCSPTEGGGLREGSGHNWVMPRGTGGPRPVCRAPGVWAVWSSGEAHLRPALPGPRDFLSMDPNPRLHKTSPPPIWGTSDAVYADASRCPGPWGGGADGRRGSKLRADPALPTTAAPRGAMPMRSCGRGDTGGLSEFCRGGARPWLPPALPRWSPPRSRDHPRASRGSKMTEGTTGPRREPPLSQHSPGTRAARLRGPGPAPRRHPHNVASNDRCRAGRTLRSRLSLPPRLPPPGQCVSAPTGRGGA